MSEKGSMQVIPLETTKLNLFHLTLPEIAGINKLMAYGYKLVDETDKDIQQYLKQKRIQERKLRKKFQTPKQIVIDKKKLTEKIRHLPEDQLKGIINLIDIKKEAVEYNEFYEIDIETLSHERLVELQKYVRSCFKSAGDSIPVRYMEEFKKNKKENQDENLETV